MIEPRRVGGLHQVEAVSQTRDGNWQATADSYAIIVRLNPYRAEDWHNYAYAQYKLGRYEDAIRAWKKSAELGVRLEFLVGAPARLGQGVVMLGEG